MVAKNLCSLFILGVLAVGCSGSPADALGDVGGPSPDGGTNVTPNANVNPNANVMPTNVTPNNGGACGDIGPRFMEAVRAMPRTCLEDRDCIIVSRANICDCDLAVSNGSDTATFDGVRAELDAAACENPFNTTVAGGCANTDCPYERLSDPGELYARCNPDNECEIVSLLPCSEYEARAQGGIAAPGGCMTAADCELRTDLNPCGCQEGITRNFPFLAIEALNEMMEINNERCNVQCGVCNAPAAATCVDDGMEGMMCAE